MTGVLAAAGVVMGHCVRKGIVPIPRAVVSLMKLVGTNRQDWAVNMSLIAFEVGCPTSWRLHWESGLPRTRQGLPHQPPYHLKLRRKILTGRMESRLAIRPSALYPPK